MQEYQQVSIHTTLCVNYNFGDLEGPPTSVLKLKFLAMQYVAVYMHALNIMHVLVCA